MINLIALHTQRFFSYLSLFTFFMLLLISADNFLFLFIGWEGVGVCSYLLINFWFTRLEANKSAMLAILMNRIGDWGFSIGIYFIFLIFGTLDFNSIFAISHIINIENIITLICILLFIGAIAKSAQLGLNTWLPQAMEGKLGILIIYIFYILLKFFESDVIYLYFNDILICFLPITKKIEEAIIGDMLGDGHISLGNIKKWPNMNGRLEFTFSKNNLSYIQYLKFIIYANICTKTEPTPYSNPKKTNKPITQYWFSTKRLSYFTKLHKIWYKEENGKFIKIVPKNIKTFLTPIGLAHWIMGDGYWSDGTVYLCTDNFNNEEVKLLIKILFNNFNLIAKINTRKKDNNVICWRIRFSGKKENIKNLRNLVTSFMIPEMLYKIGYKNI